MAERSLYGEQGRQCIPDPFASNQSRSHRDERRLIIAIVLCFIFMIAEIIGGISSHSLAIITDASHLLADIAGLLISLFAVTWSRKPASTQMSYGYHRAEILGALLSIALVWFMTLYLLMEAIQRIRHPEEINGKLMCIVASLGVLVNLIMAYVLHDHHHNHNHHGAIPSEHSANLLNPTENASPRLYPKTSINVSAAFIHVLGDFIQSVGVLIASILIWYNPDWKLADPLCTFLFSAIVVGSTAFITRDIVLTLMEATPIEVDPLEVHQDLLRVEGVLEVHDMHIWALSPGKMTATVHLTLNEAYLRIESYSRILSQCQNIVCKKYGIHHSTIQIETCSLYNIHCREHICGSHDRL